MVRSSAHPFYTTLLDGTAECHHKFNPTNDGFKNNKTKFIRLHLVSAENIYYRLNIDMGREWGERATTLSTECVGNGGGWCIYLQRGAISQEGSVATDKLQKIQLASSNIRSSLCKKHLQTKHKSCSWHIPSLLHPHPLLPPHSLLLLHSTAKQSETGLFDKCQ